MYQNDLEVHSLGREMGIPLYFKKVSHELVDIVSEKKPVEKVGRLYLDFNCAIHYCCNRIKASTKPPETDEEFEWELIEACKAYILKLKEYVQPEELVYVSIDGVVPMAKITQQRKRRFFSDFTKRGTVQWNSNAITPGTKFMTSLIRELNLFAQHCEFDIIIDAERGEGEHKICHHIRNSKAEGEELLDVIYGLDADMILLTMLSPNANKTYLLREHVKDPTILVYMNIHNTRNQIYEQFSHLIQDHTSSKELITQCYILLTFFLGNDFLPNLSYISLRSNGLSVLMEAYKKTHKQLKTHILENEGADIRINYDFLKQFLSTLSNNEDQLFFEQERAYYNTNNHTNRHSYRHKNNRDKGRRSVDDMENYPIENKFPEHINSNELGWRQNYYYHLFTKSSDTNIINIVCRTYLQGLDWLVSYYFKQETEWFWFYPYNYSPTIMDLSNYTMITTPSEYAITEEYTHTIQAIDQLLMVLPPSSLHLLPDARYKRVCTDVSLGHSHLFPTKYDICTFMKYRLHECGSQGLFLHHPIQAEMLLKT